MAKSLWQGQFPFCPEFAAWVPQLALMARFIRLGLNHPLFEAKIT